MSEEKKLGRLKKVELREYWETEDGDFTPWLAEQDNLDLLAETLDMDLEFDTREANVGEGGFQADILCRDSEDNPVVIENQLEETDHKHLGQILTYASGLRAQTAIWVAEKFRDEHRAALDSLNEITEEGRSFFGVEIELWQIEESLPAPKFNIVCKPNDWSRTTRRSASENLSDLNLLRREYWNQFVKYMEDKESPLRKSKSKKTPGLHMHFRLGKSGMWIEAARKKKQHVQVQLVLAGKNGKPYFKPLKSRKKELTDALGSQPQFKENVESGKIWLDDDQAVPLENKDDWRRQFEWLDSTLQRFDEVFRPLIEKIDPDDWEPLEGDDGA